MADILLVSGEREFIVRERPYNNERALQDLLEKHPTLIPLSDISDAATPLLVIGREVAVPSGSIDLLAIDEDGVLTIIETKLVRNPEVRREVIGQVIEYAAYLTTFGFDDVAKIASSYLLSAKTTVAAQHRDGTLDQIVASFRSTYLSPTPEQDDWTREDFIRNVQVNLAKGYARLIIITDGPNPHLERLVDFLGSHSDFDLYGMEVRYYEGPEQKLLIPKLMGSSKAREKAPSIRAKLDKNSFLETLPADFIRDEFKALFDAAEQADLQYGWGSTGFSLRSRFGDKLITIALCYGPGSYGASIYTSWYNFQQAYSVGPDWFTEERRMLMDLGFAVVGKYKEMRFAYDANKPVRVAASFMEVLLKSLKRMRDYAASSPSPGDLSSSSSLTSQ